MNKRYKYIFGTQFDITPTYSDLTRLYSLNLTFRGPCIVMYSYNKSQRDALVLKFI
jgi:hypothetical protein